MKDEIRYTSKRVEEKKVGNTDPKEKLIQLMDSYGNLVFSVCLKMTGDYFAAQDITQDTFIAAFENITKKQTKKMILSDEDESPGALGDEKAWICRIASNKCIDYLRAAERRSIPTAEEEMPENATSRDGPLEEYVARDIVEDLRNKCRKLPDNYKTEAEMYFAKGLSAKEISERTMVPLKTVQTKIYRARAMLKNVVRKEDFLS